MKLELRPPTGRSHQLRVQLAERGLPIIGDRKYGAATVLGAEDGHRRIALHGVNKLHASNSRGSVSLVAPVPADGPGCEPDQRDDSAAPVRQRKLSPAITMAANGCQAVVSKAAGGAVEGAGDDAGASTVGLVSFCERTG